MKHTPGPWHIKRNPVTVAVLADDGAYITENIRQLPNQEANARLIAAAPELVAHLIWIRDCACDIEEAKGRCMIALRQLEEQ